MTEAYDFFMVYELDDSGDKIRLAATEEEFVVDNGQNFLHPEQVLIIVKESIRRIYIWKGAKSPVRKRFISSRVGGALQEELVKNAAFHRCKIVSVDQGDEVREFLNAFRFESMPVEEKLADMRYIRNIERDKMYDAGVIPEEVQKFVKVEPKHVSPALEELEKEKVVPLPKGSKERAKKVAPVRREPTRPSPARTPATSRPSPTRTTTAAQPSAGFSENQTKTIMEKIINTEVPEGYKRQNLILGYKLYGAVTKKVDVFGKTIEETNFEEVPKVPKETIELNDRKLRVYFDDKNGIVEALEVLEKIDGSTEVSKKPKATKKKSTVKKPKEKTEPEKDFNLMTVKDLKAYANKHNIELPSGARKADIIKIIKDSMNSESGTSKRRKLPEIPKA